MMRSLRTPSARSDRSSACEGLDGRFEADRTTRFLELLSGDSPLGGSDPCRTHGAQFDRRRRALQSADRVIHRTVVRYGNAVQLACRKAVPPLLLLRCHASVTKARISIRRDRHDIAEGRTHVFSGRPSRLGLFDSVPLTSPEAHPAKMIDPARTHAPMMARLWCIRAKATAVTAPTRALGVEATVMLRRLDARSRFFHATSPPDGLTCALESGSLPATCVGDTITRESHDPHRDRR